MPAKPDQLQPPESRPHALRVRAKNIPKVLCTQRRWVDWKFEFRDGKWTKVPHQTNGRRASTTDPKTWTSFDRVLKAHRAGEWDGIGFVVTQDDDIVGIDLDHCCDRTTGEIEAWAEEIIEVLDSYNEVSPSGSGIRIFVKARFKSPVNRRDRVEIYSSGRYFTVTGHVLDERHRKPIRPRQHELDDICQKYLGAARTPPTTANVVSIDGSGNDCPLWVHARLRLHQGQNDSFSALYRGVWQGKYQSQSEADLALCSELLKIAEGDQAIADLLFRDSGLNREKWAKREDYRKSTLAIAAQSVAIRFPFRVTDNGVFWLRNGGGGPAQLAAPVKVIAQTRDASGVNWGRLLVWSDKESREHKWSMPMELLASDAGAIRARLLSEGLPFITTNARLRERFAEYLQTAPADRLVRCVARIGWHGGVFVLPDKAIGPDAREEVLYQPPHDTVHYWNLAGTADEWRDRLGRLCSGNSRLILAVSCAFAGPLLSISGAESGGLHYYGTSSTGKSTAAIVAGSVCGGGGKHGFLQSWRTTINGLEAVAEAHNDGTLFLEELAQVDARDANETAYLLGNGEGKNRMTRSIGLRKKLLWNLLFFSTGEMTLAEHVASAGKRIRGGAEVRLLNIKADVGKGHGVFEELHGSQDGDEFSQRLERVARRFYGAPLRAFLEFLTKNQSAVKKALKKFQVDFLEKYVPSGASGEVSRAAHRFALIGAAGELATAEGLTGWAEGESMNAAARCFQSWVKNRGTTGPADMEAAVRQVRMFLQAHGVPRFPLIRRIGTVDKDQVVRDQAGFRRNTEAGETEFLIFSEIFKTEFCKGYSWQAIVKELLSRGYLRRAESHNTIKVRLPGLKNPVRVYCVRETILRGDE